jgi:hypothetical protein
MSQHYGAPPHYGIIICYVLNTRFSSMWSEWEGLIACPPRTAHLMPFDFFLGAMSQA